jgi:hypothetical protein
MILTLEALGQSNPRRYLCSEKKETEWFVHPAVHLLSTHSFIRGRLIIEVNESRDMLMRKQIAQVADGLIPFVEWRNSTAPCTVAEGAQHMSREARSLNS